jgi:hypothetical protein
MKRSAARLHRQRVGASYTTEEEPMGEQDRLIALIDDALERFGSRDLVSGSEVLDFLLDLRLSLLAPDPFEQLLEEETAPTG